jgi:hypothetical protein
MPQRTCQLKGGLFGCSGPAIGMCVYCGRSFCAKHGLLLDDGAEVCARKECDAKRLDLIDHLTYKEAAQIRNETRACGLDTCDATIEAQCIRCRAYFCLTHLDVREDIVEDDGARLPRMVRMCRHCHTRRAIWSKT